MQLKQLEIDDLRYICRNMREQSRREVFARRENEDPDALADELMAQASYFAFSGHLDRPIYAGGSVAVGDGLWRTWGFGTDEFPLIGIDVAKFIRRKAIPAVKRMGGTRIESTCIAGISEVDKWLTIMGGRKEAPLPDYGKNGDDFNLWVWDLTNVR
jgi:hypothetical protein